MPKGGWKEYFIFSVKERVAVFILLAIIAVFICLSFFYTPVFTSPVIDKDVQQKLTALSSGNQKTPASVSVDGEDSTSSTPAAGFANGGQIQKAQFYFDPNTLSVEGWKKLGFKDRTIDNIMRYRDESGKFKTSKDLYNVPRIRKKLVDAILPFVRIGLKATENDIAQPLKPQQIPAAANGKAGIYKTIDVNTAAADDFMVFPGMTQPVANRIVKFRTSLQGFSSIDEVAKTYGLQDSTFKIMRPYLTIGAK